MSRLTRITIILAITLGALSCYAPIRRAVEGMTLPEGESVQQSFTSHEGGFTVGLPPTKPKCETFGDEGGHHTSCEFVWVIINIGSFRLRYLDGGSEIRDAEGGRPVLQRLRDALVEKNGWKKVVRDEDITLDGYAGREIVFEDDKGLFIQRFYVKGRRTFDFNVFLPSDYAYKRDETTKVLDSFRLTSDAK